MPTTDNRQTTRAEHLAWCKQRALEYCNQGDIPQAVASMASDMRKHPGTADHMATGLMVQMLIGGHFRTPSDCANFINGFN